MVQKLKLPLDLRGWILKLAIVEMPYSLVPLIELPFLVLQLFLYFGQSLGFISHVNVVLPVCFFIGRALMRVSGMVTVLQIQPSFYFASVP